MTRPDSAARLLWFARPFWGWMALAGLLGFLTVGSSVGLMAAGAWLISAAALHPSIAGLQVAIVGVRFFGIARGVLRYAERLAAHSSTFRLLQRLRVWLYERIEPLAPAGLIGHHSGDLLSRVVADVESLENLYMRVVGPALVALFTAVLMTVFLGQYQAGLILVFLGFYVVGGVVLPLVTGWLARRPGLESVATRGELNAALVGAISGMADLLAFNAAEREAARVADLSARLGRHRNALDRVEALSASLLIVSAGGAMLAVLAASTGKVDGIHLAAIALGVAASFEALIPLPLAARQLGAVRAASARLYELADARPAVADPPQASPAPDSFDIDARGLSFRYADGEPWVFKDLSFSLPQGERLAIAGPSGAGKTTLVNLLLRFWDYQRGEIRLGGRDLRQYHQDDVRSWIGVVSQTTHLFNTTIRDNLLVGRPDATEEQLAEAIRKAQIDDLVRSLPHGLDTWVGEAGAKLSGGERQRIAIARALLKDAPILILDEATAHLDAITGRQVMQAVESAMQGRTTLIISHMTAHRAGTHVVWLR